MNINNKSARRPLRSRNTRWAIWAARKLQRRGATPNGISVASIGFALLSGICFASALHLSTPILSSILLIIAALAIQARLLCNLLDGMVAVEGGMKTPAGGVYNELPDRIADSLIILGLGYGLPAFPWAIQLGWAAALLAILTAYIRLLGGSCGLAQRFIGPLAKQQRMALLTVAAVGVAFIPAQWREPTLLLVLMLLALGTLWTCIRRTTLIIRELNAQEVTDEIQGTQKELADE
ncbi:MAG: CDP-alcohol phosphatidyltransferase family protein [Enterobacteriaceae bacterium]